MKKTYVAIGTVTVIALSFVLVSPILILGLKGGVKKTNKSATIKAPSGIQALSASAFGKLDFAASTNTNASANAPKGMGGDAAKAGRSSANFAAEAKVMDSSVSRTMVPSMDYYNIKYVYKGEELKLEQSQLEVYRRIKGDGRFAAGLTELIGGVNLDLVDINAFSNLRMQNLSLAEDRDSGLSLYLDFNEDTVSINENWQRWVTPAAGVIEKMMVESNRLKIEDVPADEILVSMADQFLAEKGIKRDNYGQGKVEDYWRRDYVLFENKADYYVPEVVSVVYPLLINGQEVRDQSGNPSGMHVSINIVRKQVSGLYGLSPYRFESSSYETETDSARILKVAENGGYNRNYIGGFGGDKAAAKEIELGTPVANYVSTWNYGRGKSEELLVPALIFPVMSQPEPPYFSQRFVVVPLAKDMLAKLETQPTNGPVYFKDGSDGSTAGSSGSGATINTELPTPVEPPVIEAKPLRR